jgi:hypothetical protein
MSQIKVLGSSKLELNELRGIVPILFCFLKGWADETRDVIPICKEMASISEQLHHKYLNAAQEYEELFKRFLANKDIFNKAITAAGRGERNYALFSLSALTFILRRCIIRPLFGEAPEDGDDHAEASRVLETTDD